MQVTGMSEEWNGSVAGTYSVAQLGFIVVQVVCIFTHLFYGFFGAQLWERRNFYGVSLALLVKMVYNSIMMHLCQMSQGWLCFGIGYPQLLLKDMTTAQYWTLWIIINFYDISDSAWFNALVISVYIVWTSVLDLVGPDSYVPVVLFAAVLYIPSLPAMSKDEYNPVVFGLAVFHSAAGLVCYFLTQWYDATHPLWHYCSAMSLYFFELCKTSSRNNWPLYLVMAEWPEATVVDDRAEPVPITDSAWSLGEPKVVYVTHAIALWRLEERIHDLSKPLPLSPFYRKMKWIGYIYVLWGLVASSVGSWAVDLYGRALRKNKETRNRWKPPPAKAFFRAAVGDCDNQDELPRDLRLPSSSADTKAPPAHSEQPGGGVSAWRKMVWCGPVQKPDFRWPWRKQQDQQFPPPYESHSHHPPPYTPPQPAEVPPYPQRRVGGFGYGGGSRG